MSFLVLVVDDEPDVEMLFRQQSRRDLRDNRFRMDFAQRMACSKCGSQMRLVLVQSQDRNFELLTYQCGPCDSGESFLMAVYPG
jgi:hypothetical protein